MAVPRKLTKELAELNKKKLRILRSAGYNIKVDGSWGPWQEEQYKKVVYTRGRKNNTNANVGVMALPIGYGAAQLLEGLGTVSLPSLTLPSATTLAAAAPIALTLAGPAYGIYERVTGRTPRLIKESPRQREMSVYAPDATRVSKPIVTSSGLGLIGERYVNPIFSREANRSRHLATAAETANDSIAIVPVDTVRTTAPSTPPSQEPENNKDKKKDKKENSNSWFKLWEGSGTSGASKHPNFWRYVRNFGVRVPLYTGVAAPVIDVAGNMVGASRESLGLIHQWKWPLTSNRFSLERGAWKLFGDAYSTSVDSTKINNPLVSYLSLLVANPVLLSADTIRARSRYDPDSISISNLLDSINNAWFNQ